MGEKILITGANGFVGRNLTVNLQNIMEGKNTSRDLQIDQVFCYDLDSAEEELERYCGEASFVFHLAGVNRPKEQSEFMKGNFGASEKLLDCLKRKGNTCPVMLSSSIQASLTGRFSGSEYGRSKLAGEEAFFTYGRETGAKVLVYRFPNIFGKWCRPNYNSAVATFCYNTAHGLPLQVNDPNTELELVYIDDLVEEMLDALEGREHRSREDERYCSVPVTHHATLGEIVSLLEGFHSLPDTGMIPNIPSDSFEKKLLSTYESYLPKERISYPLAMKRDERGSFTELIRSERNGQVSVNISKPGITKGEHWHNSKWELFIVVSGHGLIRERKLGTDEILEFEVYGEEMRAVQMLPGYAHGIRNLSETEDLVTIMWANELFDEKHPDTFREYVDR